VCCRRCIGRAQVALLRTDDRTNALRETMSELLGMDEPRRHRLLGRRMPHLDLVTSGGPLRVFTLLHDARPVLLNLGEPGWFGPPKRARIHPEGSTRSVDRGDDE
jgi:hypothetical protein